MSAQHQPPTEDAKVAPRANETEAIGIEKRLTQILRRHRVGPGQVCRCECAPGYLTHSEHVASVLVAELGLRQRFTWSWPNGSAPGVPGYGFEVDTAAEAAQEGEGVLDVVSRYVTTWEPA